MFADQRVTITNYILENYDSVYPGYYVWRKDFFLEWCYTRWACKEILKELAENPYKSGLLVLANFKEDMEYNLEHARSERAKIIFGKALSIVDELEGLFVC